MVCQARIGTVLVCRFGSSIFTAKHSNFISATNLSITRGCWVPLLTQAPSRVHCAKLRKVFINGFYSGSRLIFGVIHIKILLRGTNILQRFLSQQLVLFKGTYLFPCFNVNDIDILGGNSIDIIAKRVASNCIKDENE